MQDALELNPTFDPDDPAAPSGSPADLTSVIADAIAGVQSAWRELYRRFESLICSTALKFRLPASSVEDVSQTVWLQLVTHLKDIREPRALPGWIVTTTRNEALRISQLNKRSVPVDPMADQRLLQVDGTQPDENLYRMERSRALGAVVAELRPQHRDLIRLLLAEPQVPYSEISRQLGIPIGSIGPTRARCLARLRNSAALAAVSAAAEAA